MYKTTLFTLVLLLTTACSHVPTAEWSEGAKQDDGRALHTLTLNNMPNAEESCRFGWRGQSHNQVFLH